MTFYWVIMNPIRPSRPRWQFSMTISHLVALSHTSVIGVNNDLPWKLKRDLQHFSAYTQKKAMVMGRKTFESIGRPLPNRQNIVISSSLNSMDGIEIVRSLDEGIEAARHWNLKHQIADEVVLIGGGHVFKESMLMVNKLVLTRVDCEIAGDVFYPEINLQNWRKVSSEAYTKDADNQYDFMIETYFRD